MKKYSILRNVGAVLVCAASIGHAGCSTSSSDGTNTGNGVNSCPFHGYCTLPVALTAPSGTRYRGGVDIDPLADDPTAQSQPDPPLVKLDVGGGPVEYSDGGCHDGWPDQLGENYGLQIFISKGDSSIDTLGTLHMHAAPAVGDFASGPSLPWGDAGWTVDLTLTADGFLDATLSTVVGGQFLGGGGTTAASGGATAASGGIFGLDAAAQGGAGGVSGFDAATAGGGTAPDASAISPDAGAMIATITIHGPIGSVCGVRDPSGTVMPTRNGVFKLPCQQWMGCDDSSGG